MEKKVKNQNWNVTNLLLKKSLLLFSIFLLTALCAIGQTVSSISALASAAANSNQTITMTPGVYDMEDYLTSSVNYDQYGRPVLLEFSGNNNTINMTGVTIEVNTAIFSSYARGLIELLVSGDNITVSGLTLTDIGTGLPTGPGMTSMTISGDGSLIENVTLNVSGSSPYGYGDMLGKGGTNLVGMKKHSGMLIEGLDATIRGCSIYSQAFGHLFFVQGGSNVLFEDCYAEAVTRPTNDVLAETSGPAYDLGFASVWPNYNGDNVIEPGYTKSLSEGGFRNYGSGISGRATGSITCINCRVKDARTGFALSNWGGGDILIKDCEAIGTEVGYTVEGVTIENSRGDAVNGPLLYLNDGLTSNVELYLMPTVATTTVNSIATIAGDNPHVVTIKKWNNTTRNQIHPIRVGTTRPTGANPYSPYGTASTTGVTLNNCTGMPVIIGSTVGSSTINTNGSVTNNSSGNSIDTSYECEDENILHEVGLIQAEAYSDMEGVLLETTQDTGGGINVGWIEAADWMEYQVNVTSSGTYDVDYRVASESNGGDFTVTANGSTIDNVTFASTGDWQNWTTVSSTVSLSAGINTIRITSNNSGWNINWFELTEDVPTNGNLALGRNTSQSSTDWGGTSPRAVDGNTNGAWSGGSVTHTNNEANPWWEVNLGSNQNIGDIVIYGRTDSCCQDRLSDFTVSVITNAGTTTYSEVVASYPDPSVTIDAGGALGRVIRIQLNGTNALSLAEVEVYADEGTSCDDDLPWSDGDFSVTQSTVNYSEIIDISCASSATISMNLEGVGNMEPADYCNVYYKVDGGSQVAISTNTDSFSEKTVSATVSGNSVEIIMNIYNSYSDETYYVSDINVQSNGANNSAKGANNSANNSAILSQETSNEFENSIKIYPNPATDHISILNSRGAQVEIYNSVGILVDHGSIETGSHSIDISQLSRGMYFVKILSEEDVITTHKILKR